MPKQKTHSGAAKRFRKTATGYKHRAQARNHGLTKHTTKRKRQLRTPQDLVCAADQERVARMLCDQ